MDKEVIIESVQLFWKDKKKRNIIILALLVLVFFVVLVNFTSKVVIEEADPNKGVQTVYICSDKNCAAKKLVRETRDSKFYCDKCSKKMAQCMKCFHCKYEFALKPAMGSGGKKLSQDEMFILANERRKCPNCGYARSGAVTKLEK